MTHRLSVAAILFLPIAVAAADLQQPAPYAFQGTVRQVQPKTGALEVVTGVGMALRLVHMRTTPATRIASGTTTVSFAELKPGDVVRAQCHQTEQGLVADRIDRVKTP